ncbi:MAG: NADPH:quinone oxidoreductase family protein [Paracoccaceae bacterium]
MKALQVTSFGQQPDVCEVAKPLPSAGQILLKVHACGVNFADLLMIEGRYQATPELPFIPGLEAAGIIEQLGHGVSGMGIGDRVAVFAESGGMAEYGCFDAARALPLPASMSFEHGAAFQVAYGTSHLALDHRAHLQAGETLLVFGAAGGVGLTAVEIGKRMGATVIAVARGADKLAVAADAGADHLIDSDTADIRAEVKALGGADVVYDPVGGDAFKVAMRVCNPQARIIVIGFASGTVPQIPANILLVKNITVIGHYWGGYMAFAPDVLRDSLATLFNWYKDGGLRPHIGAVFPLEQTNTALEMLKQRKSTGKLVITPQPEPTA